MLAILSTADTLKNALMSAMNNYKAYRWSVAWASLEFSLYDELLKNEGRISQLVVGTHFYHTHPDFLKVFVGNRRVRCAIQPRGTIHPKIYLFENSRDDWECIVGSPNFTRAAFSDNEELAVRFDGRSATNGTYDHLSGAINKHWENGRELTQNYLSSYRRLWELKQPAIHDLSQPYTGGEGKQTTTIPLLTMSWVEFVRTVKEQDDHPIQQRLDVLEAVHNLFERYRHFDKMSDQERSQIGGIAKAGETGVHWGYFGSMKGAGWFRSAVKNENKYKYISDALDAIPMSGSVAETDYQKFVRIFKKAYPGDHLAVATRLLCMKRPDVFICIDGKNRGRLCKALKIPKTNMSYGRYWSEIIERVRLEAVWWNSPRPSTTEEIGIWKGRMAFLDALFYRR
jgi:HKD family nuclease